MQANIITSIRILCGIALLFCPAFSAAFCALYITAGLSDIADGWVARKTNTVSEFGAKLDTVADVVFVVVCLVKLLPVMDIPLWLYIWIGVIAVIKIINIVSGFVVQKRFVAVHSVMNKVTGVLLFCLPLTLSFIDLRYSAMAVCSIATFAAVQEGHFIRTKKNYRINMQTERIILRPWLESDAEALFKYASDLDVGPRAGWPPHKSVEESREIIKSFFSNDDTWAIELKETSEIIGCIGVLRASVSNLKIAENECEIGYWVAKPYWGKGICTEALRLVIDYCFNVNKFNAIWGDYFPENPASGKVMEKCGFIDTGKETICPNLAVGADRPVKVMKLER